MDGAKTAAGQRRYETVAGALRLLIGSGTLAAGRKIPSIRELKTQHGVGTTTVLAALELLESEGLLLARSRSGYYVRARPIALIRPVALRMQVQRVSRAELIDDVLHASRSPDIVALGCAYPDASLYPVTRLRQHLAAILRHNPNLLASYSHSPGSVELRRQIAAHMLDWGASITHEDVIVTSGARESLRLALQLCCPPGEVAIVESPCYFGVLHIVEQLGVSTIEVAPLAGGELDLQTISRALEKHRCRAVVLTSTASNPGGGSVGLDERRDLLALLARHGAALIEDCVYADLSFAQEPASCALRLRSKAPVYVCGSFNKTLAPGMRLGWLAFNAEADRNGLLRLNRNQVLPLLGEVALADFLQSGGYRRHLRVLRQHLHRSSLRMIELIAQHFPQGTQHSSPQGGYVLWLKLPGDVDALRLFHAAVEEGISIAPGLIFSGSDTFKSNLRLSYGLAWNSREIGAIERVGLLARRLCKQ